MLYVKYVFGTNILIRWVEFQNIIFAAASSWASLVLVQSMEDFGSGTSGAVIKTVSMTYKKKLPTT